MTSISPGPVTSILPRSARQPALRRRWQKRAEQRISKREMGDIDVDNFLGNLKQLTTNSNLNFIIDEKHQLQFLEEEIKYLRGFLKSTEKKCNEHSEVMKLVKQIRDVVSEAENIVDLFVSHASKADVSRFKNNKKKKKKKKKREAIHEHQKHLSLDLKSVKEEIKTLMAEVKKIYDENMFDIIME